MSSREETIKTLEEFIRDYKQDHQENWNKVKKKYEALGILYAMHDLLKEQEPVKAVADGDSYICSNCGTLIGWVELYPGGVEEVKHKFCPECGQAVKWE